MKELDLSLNYGDDPSNGHAVILSPEAMNASAEIVTLEQDVSVIHPAILISYVYLEPFLKFQPKYHYRNWCMDSGAYSAWNSGKQIDIDKYIATCHNIKAKDPTLVEIIALDVINDGKTPKAVTAKQSLKNALYMKEKGLDVIPVFHYGEDYGILREYCAAFNKVGLSCRFGELVTDSLKFYDQCFAREWPKRFHSFGWMEDYIAFEYPFHSLDSASWRLQPSAFGYWRKFGPLSSRGEQDLRSQVKYYLDLEAKARVRFAPQMVELGDTNAPTIRLATSGDKSSARAFNHANLPLKGQSVAEENMVNNLELTNVPKAKKVKKTKPEPIAVEVKTKGMDAKWVNYWANRGLKRNPLCDVQTNLEKK